jgi:ABC-type antimicrobial peptide transport system permease subunit
VRSELRAVNKDISVYDIRPMTQVRSESMAQRRFMLLLVSSFGTLALLMAAIGVYGVMTLIVSERTPEIGVRLALGAQPSHVVRGVVLQGVSLAGVGIAVGLVLSVMTMPFLSTQLYGVRALDVPTMAGIPALLLAVAALACFVPAHRARTIDPVQALRS